MTLATLPAMLLLQVADSQREATTGVFIVASAVKMLAAFTVLLVTVAMLTLLERKIAAWIQDRRGPNRAGPGGILQPAADGLKNFMKEEHEPGGAYTPIFRIAPALAATHPAFAGLDYDALGLRGLPVVDAGTGSSRAPIAGEVAR